MKRKWWVSAQSPYCPQVNGKQSPGWKPTGDRPANAEENPGIRYRQRSGGQGRTRIHSSWLPDIQTLFSFTLSLSNCQHTLLHRPLLTILSFSILSTWLNHQRTPSSILLSTSFITAQPPYPCIQDFIHSIWYSTKSLSFFLLCFLTYLILSEDLIYTPPSGF